MTRSSQEQQDFENVISMFDKRLNRVINKFEKNSEEIEDIKQEVYIKIFSKNFKFEAGFTPWAWVKKVTENHCKNKLREKSKFNFLNIFSNDDEINILENIPDENSEIKIEINNQNNEQKIYNSIQNLKSKFRDVIILHDLENYTYEQIAKKVNCPVGTVKSRLFKARMLLKEELKDFFD